MATIFPLSASVGQVFNGYEFDGTSWNIVGVDFTESYALDSDLASHESETTNVHGISDTSVLATESYVDLSSSAVSASANSYADSLSVNYDPAGSASAVASNLTLHENKTENVHGILDTSLLATKEYADNSASSAAASLVDSAPSTLNTLNELAAALGDDENFATTVTNSLSEKASASVVNNHINSTTSVHGISDTSSLALINSPNFTGTPTAPTASFGTDSTQLATTAFVQASLRVVRNAQTASYTLVLTDSFKMVEISSTSATTLTIPLDSSVNFPIGTSITILQTNTGQITLAGASGVTVSATPGLKLRTRWSSANIIKRAANNWLAIGDLTA